VSEPATKDDLEQATTQLRGEMGAMGEQLRGEIIQLRGEMGAMEARLFRHIGEAASQVANVMLEHVRTLVAAFDDKHKDLLPAHAKLRADFDTHAADLRLHRRHPAAPAKRARRLRSQ